jgi:N-methylhydantoinase A/oxoprolinase/acetone carboxylase beta subunit
VILGELARAAGLEGGGLYRRNRDFDSPPICVISASRANRPSLSIWIAYPPMQAVSDLFVPTYKALRRQSSHVPIELVTWRVTARGAHIVQPGIDVAGGARPGRRVRARCTHGATGFACRSTIEHDCRGPEHQGPAVIEERETTTVIPPDWTATVDKIGCIFARKG